MIVVLDSNIFIPSRFHLEGADFETLRLAARRLEIRVVIPAPVIEEVVRNFRKHLEEKWRAAVNATRELSRLTGHLRRVPGPREESDETVYPTSYEMSFPFDESAPRVILLFLFTAKTSLKATKTCQNPHLAVSQQAMVTPQSLKTFEEHLHLRNPDIVSLKPCMHILCTGDTVRNIVRSILFRRALPPTGSNWRQRQLPTGHDCMITMPRELADLLLEVALPVNTKESKL